MTISRESNCSHDSKAAEQPRELAPGSTPMLHNQPRLRSSESPIVWDCFAHGNRTSFVSPFRQLLTGCGLPASFAGWKIAIEKVADMSELTYYVRGMTGKPLRWLHGEVKTPSIDLEARREMGMLLRELQDGEMLAMPHSRPMPGIRPRRYELRVNDETNTWRLLYRIDADAILILEMFAKKTRTTPQPVIRDCRRRLKLYDSNL